MRGERPRVSRHRNQEENGPVWPWLIPSGALYLLVVWQMLEAFEFNAVDDAYISFRYVDHWVSGHGLVWNVGERVEGFSNFLWVIFLIPFGLLTDDLTRSSQALGLLFGLATILLTLYGQKRILGVEHGASHLISGLLVGTSGYFAAWSVSGMESSLASFLLLWAAVQFLVDAQKERLRRPWSAIPLVGYALLRPEGIFVALGAATLHVVLRLKQGLKLTQWTTLCLPLCLGLPLVMYHLFRWTYYGPHFWPNSIRAKTGFSQAQLQRGVSYVGQNFLHPYGLLLLVGALGLRRSRHRFAAALLSALALGYLAFIALVGGDWSHGRFFAPLLPLCALLLASAGQFWLEWTPSRFLRGAAALAGLAYVAGCWQVTASQRELVFRQTYAGKDSERVALGKWLEKAAPPETVLAVFAAGQIPYYSKLKSHDMLGLNDAHISSVQRNEMGRGLPGHEKYDIDYTMETVRPDIIVDPQFIPDFLQNDVLRKGYRRERSWRRSLVLIKKGIELPR